METLLKRDQKGRAGEGSLPVVQTGCLNLALGPIMIVYPDASLLIVKVEDIPEIVQSTY